ncbi:MAG TPA: MFS transporter [Acidimicrobiia bacterium]|nr:MFS transporter [Acidimicrobiia bacterium]
MQSGTMRNDRRSIFGWAMYDWANSAYTTTTLAVLLPAIFTGEIMPEGGVTVFGRTVDGESLFSYMVSAAALVAFVLSPVMGAVGDFAARKLRFLRTFAYTGALLSLLFALMGPGDVWLTVILFLVVETCWAVAAVFYDSLLPHLTTNETIDRISSRGYAFGYLGGGIQFLISLLLIQLSPDSFAAIAARIAIVMAGLWWLGFAVFAFRRLREPGVAESLPAGARPGFVTYARIGFARTGNTIARLRKFPQLLLFLVAFLLYNDGVQTVISISAAFATETLRLDTADVALAFLVVQIVAFGGALLFGWIAGKIGPKRAIMVSLVLWTGVSILGYSLPEESFVPFLGLAASVGLVLGGTQALSRSLYGSMIPEQASAEFYGFYSVFSKFAAIWGPLLFGIVNQVTGSSRQAILSLIAFFALGFILLAFVNIDQARQAKEHWHFQGAAASVD